MILRLHVYTEPTTYININSNKLGRKDHYVITYVFCTKKKVNKHFFMNISKTKFPIQTFGDYSNYKCIKYYNNDYKYINYKNIFKSFYFYYTNNFSYTIGKINKVTNYDFIIFNRKIFILNIMPEYYIIFIDRFFIKHLYRGVKNYYNVLNNDIFSIKNINLNTNKKIINYII